MNNAFKAFSSILFNTLLPNVTDIIGPYQCVFMRGKSTIDQIHALKQILEKKTTKIQYITIASWILKWHMIAQEGIRLYEAMGELGTPAKLFRLVEETDE